jgi:transcriptional regulator with XRE-family HTH domain
VSNRDRRRPRQNRQEDLRLLGETIRRYRRQQGLTQATLATLTDLAPSYISQVEHGQRNLTVLALLDIATALHVPLNALLEPLNQPREHNPANDLL